MTNIYGSIFRNIIFPAYEGGLRQRKTLKYLREYQQHLTWPEDKILEYQKDRLESLLEHCFQNIPYYQKQWKSLGIQSIQDIKRPEDFSKLPILTKDDIGQHYNDLLFSNPGSRNIKKATGGSTGKPFQFEYNFSSEESRQAIMWRGYGWLGAGLGVKSFFLWGADIGDVCLFKNFKTNLYHRYYNRKMVNSFNMNKSNMHYYISEINKYKPDAIVAYTNPLYQLAKYIIENNIKTFSPKTIITGAEALLDFQRQTIEQAFSCKTYNTYGCREFMLIAAECNKQQGLHINSDHLIVETIHDNGNPVVNESGDLLITDLSNFRMPLIRYLNGDRAILSSQQCSCGNPLPIMTKVDGRKLDIIKTPIGGKIPGELFPHLFKEFPGIEKFQVTQKSIEKIIIFLVINDKFSDQNLEQIKTEINRYSHGSLNITFNKVPDIPLTTSGKHRVTICEI